MERTELLKSIGFTEKYIQALQEFEKAVPNIYYEPPFKEKIAELNIIDTSGQITIDQSTDDYSRNVIIRQY